jgi:hypothetical protein
MTSASFRCDGAVIFEDTAIFFFAKQRSHDPLISSGQLTTYPSIKVLSGRHVLTV